MAGYIGGKDAASDPTKTRQWAGHVKHQEHLAQQRADTLARRKAKRRKKA